MGTQPLDLPTGEQPRLRVRIVGPRVGEVRIAAADLAEVIRRTQQAVKRVGQVLYGQESRGAGRKPKDIEDLCELFVVGLESGSAVAILEVAPPPEQLKLFGYIGEQSLEAFVTGMKRIAEGEAQPSALPAGFDAGVLETCNAMGGVFDHGIDAVTFHWANGQPSAPARFDGAGRDRVRRLLGQPADLGLCEKVGRLEILDGHGSVTGSFWEADGTRWACHFKPEHMHLLGGAWMHTVRLTGRAIAKDGKQRTLQVESLVLTDYAPAPDSAPAQVAAFWTPATLEELAAQQQVSPVDDLDGIAALWPEESDPDALFEHVMTERTQRRLLVRDREG